jgi:hypothetical protein
MAKASGYAAGLPRDRMATFLSCIEEGQRFAEPVPDFQHSRNAPLVCFVICNGKITHIALGRRGNSAGTGLRRLNFDKAEDLAAPISVDRVINRLPPKIRASAKKRLRLGGLLTEKGFAAVVEAMRRIEPKSGSLLERYSTARAERIERLSSRARESLACQKEAILTALSIADITRDSLQEWMPADGVPRSFLDGLPTARLREDQMIMNDLSKIPGFDLANDSIHITGRAIFQSDTERLTVVLANRLPLEEQTGTDLIYFNETFQSFVMVQYKAMEYEDDGTGRKTAGFRLPNAQLAEEIARMESLLATLRACQENAAHDGFRLIENPFFLKLCPRIVFKPDDTGLVPGMYLPLDYWKLLENYSGLRGPRGGLRVTYENVGRHFDNTGFTAMVAKSWVGTTPAQSAVLRDAFRQTIETGKAVALAVKPIKDTLNLNAGKGEGDEDLEGSME